jgi:hypothetical protein
MATSADPNLIHVIGIDTETAQYAFTPRSIEDLAEQVLVRPGVDAFEKIHTDRPRSFGMSFGMDPTRLYRSGWESFFMKRRRRKSVPHRIFQPACHNKTIILDGKVVMFGSHNWSNEGVKTNRDASLIFDDREVAGYLAQVYEYDWNRLATAHPTRSRPRWRGITRKRLPASSECSSRRSSRIDA